MASLPQHHEPQGEEEVDLDLPATGLPGHTVDALLEQGRVEDAREELARLLMEGIKSGSPGEMTPEFFNQLRERGRQAALRRR